MLELTIAHRVCPVLSRTAVGFSDKYEMVKSCAESLYVALEGVRAKLIVILDGCDDRYEKLFPGAEIVKTESVGNLPTYAKQIEILSNADTEFVYFSEDDYLYKPNAFKMMLEVMSRSEVDFVTPIDHPDRYDRTMEQSRFSQIIATVDRHWRTVGTTCLTFMTRRETLAKTKRVLSKYATGAADSVMWLGLTKDSTLNPVSLVRSMWWMLFRLFGGRVKFWRFLPIFAWRAHGFRLLFGRRYKLWSPLPQIAEHLSSDTISPTANKKDRVCE